MEKDLGDIDGTTQQEVFISYLNDDDKKVEGYFVIVSETANYITFRSKSSEITIPYVRLLKIKKRIGHGN